ncbi:MAG: RBBP9/YdeN family alpha/beta hydrolase [Jatrophihabitantaceae bacterium]
MARKPLRAVPTLILAGSGDAGPEHWCSWLAAELATAGRTVRLPSLSRPAQLAGWTAQLRGALRELPDVGFDVVAHSLACLLWLHHASAASGLPRPGRVALVGLPDAEHADAPSFFPVPLDADAVRRAAEGTVLIGSDNDPRCPRGAAAVYGTPLKIATTVTAGAGHFEPASGYGAWPAMLAWCNRENLAFF